MSETQFFGYGSLVNHTTHGYDNARPARLAGWRRRWVSTSLRPVAYLSVEPWQGEIAGLVADVPGGDWSALDAREAAYDKHPVTVRLHECGSEAIARVYAVAADHAAPPDTRHPVLLSYIDTVVQGFLEVFGAAGARAFFESTVGWDCPILDDRAAPRYPRATRLSAAEIGVVDAGLAAVIK
ncbi:MAG: gamma-glutamylcyclotransferase family protein [Pseudomonadota bacterium]